MNRFGFRVLFAILLAAYASAEAHGAVIREYVRIDGRQDIALPGRTVMSDMFADDSIWGVPENFEGRLKIERHEGRLSVCGTIDTNKIDTAWGLCTRSLPLKEKGLGFALSFGLESSSTLIRVQGGKTYSCVVVWKDMLGKEIARDPFALHANKARHRHAVYFGSIPAEAESFTVQLGFDAPNLMAGDRLTFDHLDFSVMPRETDPAWTQVKEPEPPRVRIVSKTPFTDPFAPLVVSIECNGAKIDWEKFRVKLDGRTATKQFRRESGRISYVPEKEWTPGLHTVDIEFPDAEIGESFKARKWFFRGEAPNTPGVTLRDDGMVLVGGEPFFPIGIYGVMKREFNAYDFDRAMADLKTGGFNTVHSYVAGRSSEFLDAAQRHGLKVWTGARAPDKRFVDVLRHHPAIIAWYVGDDTSMHDTPPEVYDRTDAMKAVDPTRITVQADVIRSWDAFSAYRPFVKATDGLLPEIYPVHEVTPNPMPSCVAETIRDMKKFHSDVAEAGDGSPRTVWPIIQNFKGWTSWKRFPTQDELYAMSFASIIHGANGITWYTYGGTIIPEKKKFNYGITTSEEIWRGMTNLATRLNRLAPVFVERTPKRQPKVAVLEGPLQDDCLNPSVTCLMKHHGGKTYVFAVNSACTRVKASFGLDGASALSAAVAWEDRVVRIDDGKFTDVFRPFDVHVYLLKQ